MTQLPPAWEMNFEVRASDREGMVTGWKFTDTCETDRYRIGPSESSDSLVVGEVVVTCWQPYKKDAQAEAIRAVRDLCNVYSVSVGGVLFVPVLPPAGVKELKGAKKSGGGVGVSVSATLSAIHSVKGDRQKLEAAAALDEGTLRADTDTFLVAAREEDGPTRAVTLYRIYEGVAQDMLESEPPLLEDEVVEEAVAAATREVDGRQSIPPERRQQLADGFKSNLRRLRTRSRPQVLAERFSELLGRSVDPATVRKIDELRGGVAHRPTEAETQLDHDAEQLLFDVVWQVLRQDLGLQQSSDPATDATA